MIRRPPGSTLFPSPPLFRSVRSTVHISGAAGREGAASRRLPLHLWTTDAASAGSGRPRARRVRRCVHPPARGRPDRKSTRLDSSHLLKSYAVFFLQKKKKEN